MLKLFKFSAGTRNCKIKGTTYSEGEKIEDKEKQCENCYCLKGNVQCKPIICPVPLEQCSPVLSPGHCCPTSYNCSKYSLNLQDIYYLFPQISRFLIFIW